MAEQKLDVKISTTADVSGANQATKSLDGVAQAGQRGATWINSTSEAAKTGATAFDELKRGGENVGKVFGGLQQASSGGIGGIVGLTRAAQGLLGVFRALSAGAIGGVIGGLGLVGGVLVGAGKIFLETRAHLDSVRDGLNLTSKSAEDFAQELKEMKEASDKSLKKQLEDVEKLSKGYSELLSRMDAAEKRAGDVNKLQNDKALAALNLAEKTALAGAKTEADRVKISGDFEKRRTGLAQRNDDIENENKVLAAKTRRDAAVQTLSDSQALIDVAQRQQLEATSSRESLEADAMEAAKAVSRAYTPLQKAKANQAFDNAGGALRNARAAEAASFENVKTVTIEADKVMATAADQIDTANNTVADSKVIAETTKMTRQTQSLTVAPINSLSEPTTERTDSLRGQLKAAEDAQFADRTFGGNSRLNDNVSMLKAAVVESAEADAKQLSVFTAQVQAQVASRKKMAREMEKVSTRANDNRP